MKVFLRASLAYFLLIAADIIVALGGFAALHRAIKHFPVRRLSPPALPASEVDRAVDLALSFYFKRVQCLQRAAVATWLTRLCGFSSVCVLGVKRAPFNAHAWVQIGDLLLHDKPDFISGFVVIDVL